MPDHKLSNNRAQVLTGGRGGVSALLEFSIFVKLSLMLYFSFFLFISFTYFWKLCIVHTDHWAFFGNKWNAFENSRGNPQGITRYACLGGEYNKMDQTVKKLFGEVVEVFKLPLWDLINRQKTILDLLVKSSYNSLGNAVAVGKNFSSSCHTDQDGGYTFSGCIFIKLQS